MRHAFVNQGGPKYPDRAKLAKYEISRLYYEARDPQVDAQFFDQLRAIPLEVGIMRDPGWTHSTLPELAHLASEDIVRFASGGKQLAVLFDVEFPFHKSSDILTLFSVWRSLRPTRMTAWTPEFHQGGWFTANLVAAIRDDPNFAVLPQSYTGDPPQAQDPDLTRCDLTNRGVPKDRVGVFYLPGDVAHRESWDGAVFGFNELP